MDNPKLQATMRYINSKGFTIIEVTIVIVVIGILMGIVYGSYQGTQNRAKATVIYNGFKDIEEAFRSFANSDGVEQWWPQSAFGSIDVNDDPTIKDIIEMPSVGFDRYMTREPEAPTGLNISYAYDQDFEYDSNDSFDPAICPNPNPTHMGVNIVVKTAVTDSKTVSIFKLVDKLKDDDNPNCGRITITNFGSSDQYTGIFYHIAINKDDYPSSL